MKCEFCSFIKDEFTNKTTILIDGIYAHKDCYADELGESGVNTDDYKSYVAHHVNN